MKHFDSKFPKDEFYNIDNQDISPKNNKHRNLETHFSNESLSEQIIHLIKILSHYNFSNINNSSQLNILKILLHNNGIMTQRELTLFLNIKPASVSELLEKLQQKKFILRTQNKLDHRVVDIHLTQEGYLYLQEIQEFNNESFEIDVLTEEEKLTLLNLLQKLENYYDSSRIGKFKRGHKKPQHKKAGPHRHGHHKKKF